jgi:alkyl hydroperoxide reductase subunit D
LLQHYFSQKALAAGATDLELSEMLACASVMSANNILYRFRHFMGKETYDKMPAGIRMNIMMGPSVGKEFFELCSLAISAVNGCEACVTAHEAAVRNLGTSESRVFEAIKLASIVTAVGKNIY